MIEVIDTHTGKIFVDRENGMEYLTVGDYGKADNIKADFLGLTKEIYGVRHHAVDLSDKWVATISTQRGCAMRCRFCDCPTYGFHSNLSIDELGTEISTMLGYFAPTVKRTKRFNVHFARMGEPTFNPAVIPFTVNCLRQIVHSYIWADTIHPVVSTMLPKANHDLESFLQDWCKVKNVEYFGEAGLQFSINSTSDQQREWQMQGMSLSLSEIARIAERLPMPVGRKYTLNFAVTKDTVLDADALSAMFDKEKWIVKITPIHETHAAKANTFDVGDTYTDYNVYRKFEEPLLERGWDVIVFVPSKEEDSDRITCGNALISR